FPPLHVPLKPMVSVKDKARERFVTWFNDALDRAGVVEGRGRALAVSKRYKVTKTAARKWLVGETLPDSARMLAIVTDLEGATGLDEIGAYQHIVTSSQSRHVRDASRAVQIASPEIAAG